MSSTELAAIDEENAAPRRQRKTWRIVLSVVTLSILAWLGRPYYGELDEVWRADWGYLAAVVAMSMVTRMFSMEIYVQTLAGIGCMIPRVEAFMLMMLRAYSSLLVPRSGFGTTGFYLKKRYGVRYASYTALLLPIGIVQCLVIGLLGLGIIVLLRTRYEAVSPSWVIAVFGCSGLFASLALLIRIRLPEEWSGKLAHFVQGFSDAWHDLSRNRTLLVRLVVLHTCGIVGRAFRLYLVFLSLGLETHFLGVVVASLLADLAFIFAVTPAGLGFREAAIVFGAGLTGVTRDDALAAAFLDRLVMISTMIVLAQISLWKMPGIVREE